MKINNIGVITAIDPYLLLSLLLVPVVNLFLSLVDHHHVSLKEYMVVLVSYCLIVNM